MSHLQQNTLSKQIVLDLAIAKALQLLPNTQVRVTSEKQSYWVFNFDGKLFIGSMIEDDLPEFFKNQKQFLLIDKQDKKTAQLQFLAIPSYCKN